MFWIIRIVLFEALSFIHFAKVTDHICKTWIVSFYIVKFLEKKFLGSLKYFSFPIQD